MTLEDLGSSLITEVPTSQTPAMKHTPVVMGLHAATSYRIHVTATDGTGASLSDTLDLETGPLPPFLAGLETLISDAERMQPGYTLFSGTVEEETYSAAVDGAGEVVYFSSGLGGNFVPTSAGSYLAETTHGGPLIVTDLRGQSMGATLTPQDYNTPTFHHTPGISPEGNYLAIGVEMRTIDGYPGAGDGTSYNVIGDLFFEIAPDGALLREIALLDLLDPHRTMGGFDNSFWNMDFPAAEGGTKDWSHSNSIASDPLDGGYVVSVLHQNWVVKLNHDTDTLLWRLGPEGDFDLAPGGRWSRIHHGAVPLPGGRILLYDNLPTDPPLFSRAVEYTLDPVNGIATQTWEYQAEPGGITDPMGEVHPLDNGNILICDSSMAEEPNQDNGPTWARLVEVTYPGTSEEVFRLTLKVQDGGPKMRGCKISSAHRIPSLY